MLRKSLLITVLILALFILGLGIWAFFFNHAAPNQPAQIFGFPIPGSNVTSTQTVTPAITPIGQNPGSIQNPQQKIFKIADGPIASAIFLQSYNPTTTLVRFMDQQKGHVYDLPVDSQGSILRTVSDTTIPAASNAFWAEGGNALIIQYLDNGTVKSVFVEFQRSTSSQVVGANRIQFLPDGIETLAVSPDGTKVVYLLDQQGPGIAGYIANIDGSQSKKLFSLPLKALVAWPAPSMILLQTRSADQTPGEIFSVSPNSGRVSPMVYGLGITALGNRDGSEILYQTRFNSTNSTYLHILKSGKDFKLPDAPIPEKCVWGAHATSTLYCADPVATVYSDYLDLWHQGAADIIDFIDSYYLPSEDSASIGRPGTVDGGISTAISYMAISPDDHYLLYIDKDDRSLWGVRLTAQ